MGYDSNCNNCPYIDQNHLNNEDKTNRENPPIELEKHNSDILLVFQSPGTEEWKEGKAIQATKKRGGTAGRRIELSWEKKGKVRNHFDIINTVQCFPGNDGERDFKPDIMSICSCSNRLKQILTTNKYSKIIAFGEIAQSVVKHLTNKLEIKTEVIKRKHPTGGLSNEDLDNLW